MVYAICVTHTQNRPDADDCFQEVFLAYHRKQPVCHDEEHLKAWLIRTSLTITRRVSSSSWRTRVRPMPEVDPPAEAFRFDQEELDDLLAALAGLGETYRSVIHLFYLEDMAVDQIADVLGIEPGAVKMRLSRGRTALREAMAKEDAHV